RCTGRVIVLGTPLIVSTTSVVRSRAISWASPVSPALNVEAASLMLCKSARAAGSLGADAAHAANTGPATAHAQAACNGWRRDERSIGADCRSPWCCIVVMAHRLLWEVLDRN